MPISDKRAAHRFAINWVAAACRLQMSGEERQCSDVTNALNTYGSTCPSWKNAIYWKYSLVKTVQDEKKSIVETKKADWNPIDSHLARFRWPYRLYSGFAMCPSWHRCRTSFCFSFHGSAQSLAAPAGKTARPLLTSPETCSSANKVSIDDDYLRPISDLSRWFAPKVSLHSAKWTDLCQRDRQTDIDVHLYQHAS